MFQRAHALAHRELESNAPDVEADHEADTEVQSQAKKPRKKSAKEPFFETFETSIKATVKKYRQDRAGYTSYVSIIFYILFTHGAII